MSDGKLIVPSFPCQLCSFSHVDVKLFVDTSHMIKKIIIGDSRRYYRLIVCFCAQKLWELYRLQTFTNTDATLNQMLLSKIFDQSLRDYPKLKTKSAITKIIRRTAITGCIQTELMTCCLGRKHKNLVLLKKNFNFYVYVSVDNDTINNSGRYFSCEVCNLESIMTKL